MPDYTYLCLCLVSLGSMWVWTLLWAYLLHREDPTLSWWLWTGFQKWHILLLVRKCMMPLALRGYTSRISISYMDYLHPLYRIKIISFWLTFHPQTNGQKEVVNRSLGNLLRCLIKENLREWEAILPLAEFAFNIMPPSIESLKALHSRWSMAYNQLEWLICYLFRCQLSLTWRH